jgi:DNA-binding beta-propeller fold protein YncE
VPGDPFGVAATADGHWSFVSLLPNGSGGAGAIGVFADTGSATPRLIRQIPVSGQPLGVALTPGGFSASRLRGDPAHALIARAAVGEAPVGLALVDGGQRVVVADSNRFSQPGARSTLAVVNVAAALAHRPALTGYLPAGGFPRQMALEPGGRVLLVTKFASQQLEIVSVTNLPR